MKLDGLDEEVTYSVSNLTIEEKIKLHGLLVTSYPHIYGYSTEEFFNGKYNESIKHRNQAKGVVYITNIKQWRAQLSVDMNVAKSLAPIIKGSFKREYKNSQFIVI